MNTTKLTLEHTFELSDEFFHDLTITFIETNHIGWRKVMEYSYHEDDNGNGNYIVDKASIVELDESENVPAVVEATLITKELLMLGIQRLANPAFKVAKSTKVQLFECLSDPENEFPDIKLADCIVQAALFGELKYG